jgi:hypothetical protein
MKRPLSITIIAWILIVAPAVSVLLKIFQFLVGLYLFHSRIHMTHSLPFHVATFFIPYIATLAIFLVIGIFLLRGANWSRTTYVVVSVLSAILNLLFLPFTMNSLPPIAVSALFILFLYRPKANAYFAQSTKAA